MPMKSFPGGRRRGLAILVGTALGFAAWTLWPQVYDSIRRADRVIVYEGLPHPMYEEEALRRELEAGGTIEFAGYPFYREPLDVAAADVEALRTLMGDRSLYRPYVGEKDCGGFHPDYAVEWSSGGKTYRALICFGCSEAWFEGPRGEVQKYDLRRDARVGGKSLLEVLRAYRKNRPAHEWVGPGTRADSAPVSPPRGRSGT